LKRRSVNRVLATGFVLFLGVAAWVGCDAIVGITDGQLAGDGGNDGSLVDGPGGDARGDSPPVDGPTGDASDAAVHDGPAYSGPIDTLVNVTDGAALPDPHESPSLAVLPAGDGGNSTLVVTYIDYDNTNFPFPHADSWSLSTNSGASFVDEGTFPDPDAGGAEDLGDPGIAADPDAGKVYVASPGGPSGNLNQVAFFVSPNRGASFAAAVNAADPSFPVGDFTDVPSLAVDTFSGQGQGLGDVYTAYIHFSSGLDLHVSNSGTGFTQTIAVTRSGTDAVEIPRITVAPSRYIHVVYYSQVAMQPSVNLVTSRNQGVSFDPETKIAPLHVPFVSGNFYGELGINGTGPDGGATPVDMFASPQIAANPISGNLYVVFADSTQGADKANVYFTHSEDSGTTWSPPAQVNDDKTTNDQFLPAIAVSPDGARLAIDFYDRRDDPSNVKAYRYGVTADVAGATVTFGPNFRVSAASFPILVPNAPNSAKFSIQTSMGADRTYFYDAYSDGRDGNIDVRLSRYGILY
jgi:hypothetical protein